MKKVFILILLLNLRNISSCFNFEILKGQQYFLNLKVLKSFIFNIDKVNYIKKYHKFLLKRKLYKKRGLKEIFLKSFKIKAFQKYFNMDLYLLQRLKYMDAVYKNYKYKYNIQMSFVTDKFIGDNDFEKKQGLFIGLYFLKYAYFKKCLFKFFIDKQYYIFLQMLKFYVSIIKNLLNIFYVIKYYIYDCNNIKFLYLLKNLKYFFLYKNLKFDFKFLLKRNIQGLINSIYLKLIKLNSQLNKKCKVEYLLHYIYKKFNFSTRFYKNSEMMLR